MRGEITTCPANEILNLLSFVAFALIIILMAFSKEIPFSYTLLSFLFLLVPVLSGFLDAMPRYILPAFPIFLYVAIKLEKFPRIQPVYFAVSGIFLAILTLIFTRGSWIA